MNNKYPFYIRLFLIVPAIIVVSVMWALIALVSDQSLAKVLKETGENLLND